MQVAYLVANIPYLLCLHLVFFLEFSTFYCAIGFMVVNTLSLAGKLQKVHGWSMQILY